MNIQRVRIAAAAHFTLVLCSLAHGVESTIIPWTPRNHLEPVRDLKMAVWLEQRVLFSVEFHRRNFQAIALVEDSSFSPMKVVSLELPTSGGGTNRLARLSVRVLTTNIYDIVRSADLGSGDRRLRDQYIRASTNRVVSAPTAESLAQVWKSLLLETKYYPEMDEGLDGVGYYLFYHDSDVGMMRGHIWEPEGKLSPLREVTELCLKSISSDSDEEAAAVLMRLVGRFRQAASADTAAGNRHQRGDGRKEAAGSPEK